MDSEHYTSEISALRRKLDSKTEALLILSQELNKCRIERNQFRLLSERIQVQTVPSKDSQPTEDYGLYSGCYSCNNQLQEIKDKNRALLIEIEDLKQKLIDAQGDIKVLRKENEKLRTRAVDLDGGGDRGRGEALVRRVEEWSLRVRVLEAEVTALMDEKAELVRERDTYREKVHRLNHELASSLSIKNGSLLIDVDTLVIENKYLQERLEQVIADKDLTLQTLSKYKAMLDKRRNKGNMRVGSHSNNFGMIVTHKQVEELLVEGERGQWGCSLGDMRSLCSALLEALQDKALALAHQKRANRILAGRVTELESRLGEGKLVSNLLLKGYTGTTIDNDLPHLGECEVEREKESEVTLSDSDGESAVGSASAEMKSTLEDGLPAELQALVMKAMQDIREDSHSIN